MGQIKIRTIMSSNTQKVFGITIPPKLAEEFENTYFTIKKSTSGIFLESGTQWHIKLSQFGNKLDL